MLARLPRAWRLYLLLIGSRIRAQMQYKVSFVLEFFGTLASAGVDLTVIVLMFGHIKALAGWTLPEVCILYGMSSVAFALSELFFGGFDYFSNMVRTGQFDGVLMRPVSDFQQLLSSEFFLRRFGRLTQGLAALAYGLANSSGGIQGLEWLLLLLAVFGGAMVYGSLLVAQATFCFWSVEGIEIFNIITYGGNEVMSHPLDIYGPWLRRFVLFVVPLAFINYVPVGACLGKPLAEGLPAWGGIL